MPRKRDIPAQGPPTLGLTDALLETVLALETADGVPAEGRLGKSRFDEFKTGDRYGPAATGPALMKLPGSLVGPTRRLGAQISYQASPDVRELVPKARVPAIPNFGQLAALLFDHTEANASTTAWEKRLCIAHLGLVDWLSDAKLQAWGRWQIVTRRGETFGKAVAPIRPEDWRELEIHYSAEPLEEETLLPTCSAKGIGSRWVDASGAEIEGALTWSEVEVDLNQFRSQLDILKSSSSGMVLVRPREEGDSWKVRFDDRTITIHTPTTKQGLTRGLMSLWLLLNAPQAKLPYLLLDAAPRRAVETRPNEGDIEKKRARNELRTVLAYVFHRFWEADVTPAALYEEVCNVLDAQLRSTTGEEDVLHVGDILNALKPERQHSASLSISRAPPHAQETKRNIRDCVALAVKDLEVAAGGRLPGLLTDSKTILDDIILGKSLHWAVFAPPPHLRWRAE